MKQSIACAIALTFTSLPAFAGQASCGGHTVQKLAPRRYVVDGIELKRTVYPYEIYLGAAAYGPNIPA